MNLQSIQETVIALKQQLLGGAGAWGPVVLGALFIGSALIGMPVFYLVVLAGMMYGLGGGYALIMGCVFLAVFLVHALVRGALRKFVERKLKTDRRLKILDQAISEEGAKVVFFLRMTPLLPLGIGSYLFSLTGIRTVPYFVATLLGVAPGAFFYVWLGSTLNHTVEGLGEKAGTFAMWAQWIGLISFGIAFVYLSLIIKKGLTRYQLEQYEAEAAP